MRAQGLLSSFNKLKACFLGSTALAKHGKAMKEPPNEGRDVKF
jgi:hypothetical protein